MRTRLLGLAAASLLALTACASTDSSGDGDSIDVAFIYSKTGMLSVYSPSYIAGFEAGLDYATDGTGEVDGRKINVNYLDDAGDPAKAIAAFKDEVGKGAKVVLGTEDSGIAVQLAPLAEQNEVLYINGASAVDAITGVNDYTFRSGRQSFQDVAAAGSFLDDPKGKKVLVFAQDSTFGKGNAAAVEAVLGGAGAEVSTELVPADATDITPFAVKVKNANPDLVFAAWAGNTTQAMWKAMGQQGVFDETTVVTGLGNLASYPAYGEVAEKIDFLGHYFPGAGDNEVDQAMLDKVEEAGGEVDIFSPDGFVAAQMLVRALESSPDDVEKMIAGLEDWTFEAPKGEQTIRAEDHAMIQPMFQVKLSGSGEDWTPEVTKPLAADDLAPPLP